MDPELEGRTMDGLGRFKALYTTSRRGLRYMQGDDATIQGAEDRSVLHTKSKIKNDNDATPS